jgi:hypothetical protein
VQLVADCLAPAQQQEALSSLAPHPDLQFSFLRASVRVAEDRRQAQREESGPQGPVQRRVSGRAGRCRAGGCSAAPR